VIKAIIIMSIAIVLDLIFGDPIKIPHPIIYIGKLISWMEKRIRKSKIPLKIGGYLLLLGTVGITAGVITLLLQAGYLIHPYVKDVMTIYLLYTSLAAKCLKDEVLKVWKALEQQDLVQARKQLSYLVGRDTECLTREEVIRGAVETAAENTVDGILGPLMFIGLGMLMGIPVQCVFIYKAVNTLDSMVGYLQEHYKDIGYASAKTDDLFNYIPARVGSLCMLIGGGIMGYDFRHGWKILWRDRRNHKSPNCGYPESAVAGLLHIQIGGTNTYFHEVVVKPTIGDDDRTLEPGYMKETIGIMYMSEIVTLLLMIGCILLIMK